jgi:hypothetical protein
MTNSNFKWENKSLEELENHQWGEPTYSSHLVTTTYALRKKKLCDFEVEDLRIMIGQNMSLPHLIPMALDVLKDNILAEGDYYEGDLLKMVLSCEEEYWKENRENYRIMKILFKQNKQKLKQFDILDKIKEEWFEAFEHFKHIQP